MPPPLVSRRATARAGAGDAGRSRHAAPLVACMLVTRHTPHRDNDKVRRAAVQQGRENAHRSSAARSPSARWILVDSSHTACMVSVFSCLSSCTSRTAPSAATWLCSSAWRSCAFSASAAASLRSNPPISRPLRACSWRKSSASWRRRLRSWRRSLAQSGCSSPSITASKLSSMDS